MASGKNLIGKLLLYFWFYQQILTGFGDKNLCILFTVPGSKAMRFYGLMTASEVENFSTRFNGTRSKSHRLWAGVPQGKNMDHISTRVFNEWKGSTRLKRFSPPQLDKDIRSRINLEHSSLDFVQEPPFSQKNHQVKLSLV
ncbi:hypothetical protein CEXT_566611 [Caerostris extrusa]|uniref:Uncharacterized protein n=1 Tax=Caerostris extrusa TaxID=172846 RepID=A0AAV4QQE1_CAEEX|nr:hypothetical protein CEXT_566611 [Caerostris extrusa]